MSEFVLPDTLMKFAQDQADTQSKNENNLSFWFPKICTMKSTKVLRMPLQCEFRCFFDVDSKTVYHIVPYWEEGVMRTHLREDLAVFEKALPTLKRNFEDHKSEVVHRVETALQDNFLPKGSRWSVDILLDKNQDYWLIDMAKAENSYYNPEKS